MKKNNIFFLSKFIIILCFLISCEEDIDIELNTDENKRIVVAGRITNEYKSHSIRLTQTASYFRNDLIPPLINAEVYLVEENGGERMDFLLTDSIFGLYSSPEFSGTIGETYSLYVNSINESESFKATTFLDTVAQMDSINYEYEYNKFWEEGFYKIRMSAFEPEPKGNIYMFYIYLNDTLVNNKMSESIFQDDELFNGQYLANIDLFYLPQEEVINDTNVVKVEMLSISEEEYEFINVFFLEVYANNSLFSGPPANIPSNLKNTGDGLDGLGFFAASAITSLEMALIKEHDESTNDPDYKP